MSFKPGDLAVIARPNRKCDMPYQGYIVQLVERSPWGEWFTEPELPSLATCGAHLAWADAELDPIRDPKGDDETLAWAGRPTPLETPVTA